MRYRLRTLMILLAVGPPIVAFVFGATVDGSIETIERRFHFFIVSWLVLVVAVIVVDWQQSRRHFQ